MKEFLKKLKSFSGLISGVSTLLPGATFFVDFAPPYFKAIAIIATPLSAVFVYFGYLNPTRTTAAIIKLAKKTFFFSLVTVLFYILFFSLTTVKLSNSKTTQVDQIGFWTATWSITDSAKAKINEYKCDDSSPKKLLLNCFTSDSVDYIWKENSIVSFGLLNIVLFLTTFLLWSYGWGLLVKLV